MMRRLPVPGRGSITCRRDATTNDGDFANRMTTASIARQGDGRRPRLMEIACDDMSSHRRDAIAMIVEIATMHIMLKIAPTAIRQAA